MASLDPTYVEVTIADADDDIDMLREVRGEAVLCNPAFRNFLTSNEKLIRGETV